MLVATLFEGGRRGAGTGTIAEMYHAGSVTASSAVTSTRLLACVAANPLSSFKIFKSEVAALPNFTWEIKIGHVGFSK